MLDARVFSLVAFSIRPEFVCLFASANVLVVVANGAVGVLVYDAVILASVWHMCERVSKWLQLFRFYVVWCANEDFADRGTCTLERSLPQRCTASLAPAPPFCIQFTVTCMGSGAHMQNCALCRIVESALGAVGACAFHCNIDSNGIPFSCAVPATSYNILYLPHIDKCCRIARTRMLAVNGTNLQSRCKSDDESNFTYPTNPWSLFFLAANPVFSRVIVWKPTNQEDMRCACNSVLRYWIAIPSVMQYSCGLCCVRDFHWVGSESGARAFLLAFTFLARRKD